MGKKGWAGWAVRETGAKCCRQVSGQSIVYGGSLPAKCTWEGGTCTTQSLTRILRKVKQAAVLRGDGQVQVAVGGGGRGSGGGVDGLVGGLHATPPAPQKGDIYHHHRSKDGKSLSPARNPLRSVPQQSSSSYSLTTAAGASSAAAVSNSHHQGETPGMVRGSLTSLGRAGRQGPQIRAAAARKTSSQQGAKENWLAIAVRPY